MEQCEYCHTLTVTQLQIHLRGCCSVARAICGLRHRFICTVPAIHSCNNLEPEERTSKLVIATTISTRQKTISISATYFPVAHRYFNQDSKATEELNPSSAATTHQDACSFRDSVALCHHGYRMFAIRC